MLDAQDRSVVPKTEPESDTNWTPIQSGSKEVVSKKARAKLIRPACAGRLKLRQKVQSQTRGWPMFKQFENPEEAKVEDETVARESADEKIQHVAEKAAVKSTKTEQEYDKDHTIFKN